MKNPKTKCRTVRTRSMRDTRCCGANFLSAAHHKGVNLMLGKRGEEATDGPVDYVLYVPGTVHSTDLIRLARLYSLDSTRLSLSSDTIIARWQTDEWLPTLQPIFLADEEATSVPTVE